MSREVVRMLCPNLKCRTVLAVPAHAQGKRVRCRACGTRIMVPKDCTNSDAKKKSDADKAA